MKTQSYNENTTKINEEKITENKHDVFSLYFISIPFLKHRKWNTFFKINRSAHFNLYMWDREIEHNDEIWHNLLFKKITIWMYALMCILKTVDY